MLFNLSTVTSRYSISITARKRVLYFKVKAFDVYYPGLGDYAPRCFTKKCYHCTAPKGDGIMITVYIPSLKFKFLHKYFNEGRQAHFIKITNFILNPFTARINIHNIPKAPQRAGGVLMSAHSGANYAPWLSVSGTRY